jgi:hypothetical protein
MFWLLTARQKRKQRMKEILLAYKEMSGNATAQAYTFAIRTSRHTSQKLQKSMLFCQRSNRIINESKRN